MPQLAALTAGEILYYAFVAAVFVYSVYDGQRQKRLARQRAKDAYNASLEDRLNMTATVDGARSRVYGRTRNVDGVLFKAPYGADNRYYVMVVALAGHECDAIEEVYFNDQKLKLESDGAGGFWVMTKPYLQQPVTTEDQFSTVLPGGGVAELVLPNGYLPDSITVDYGEFIAPATAVDGVVTLGVSSDYSPGGFGPMVRYQVAHSRPKARLWKYLGAPGQDLGTYILAGRFPDLINTPGNDDRFEGFCGVVVEFEYDQDAFPLGIPQVTGLVRGAKCYDPRTGLTEWTQNPAIIARDWSLYANGGACDLTELNSPALIAAANACDISTDFTTPAGVETRPLYQCDIVCKLDVSPENHLNEIVESMAGKWGWAGGKLTMVAGVYRAPVAHITEDWVAFAEGEGADGDELTIIPQPPRSDVVNVFRPSIADADADPDTPLDQIVQAARDGTLTPAEKPTVISAYQALVDDRAATLALATGAGLLIERTYYTDAYDALTAYLGSLTTPTAWNSLSGNTTVSESTLRTRFDNVYVARQQILRYTNTKGPLAGDNLITTQAYVVAPIPEVRSEAYIEADGQELAREVSLGGVSHNVHAQHICGVIMRDARDGMVLKLPCNMRAWQLELFDTVTVTLPFFGFDAKEFEVIGWQFGMTKGVTLTLKETGASIFDPDGNFDNPNAFENTNLVLPWEVPIVAGVEVTSDIELIGDGTPQTRVRVTWDQVENESVRQSGKVEVQYVQLAADFPAGDWPSRIEEGGATETTIVGLKQGEFYMFRVRAINTLRIRGPWCVQKVHQVASPPNADVEAAQAAADAAQAAATAALTELNNIASDNVLTPNEKPRVIMDRDVILAEQADIDAKATAQGITVLKALYDSAVTALTAYLATLDEAVPWDDLSGNTSIVGATFRTKFADVYEARQALLNLIAVTIAESAVDTDQLAPGAATEYFVATPANTTWTTPTSDPRGVYVKNLANITYTNTSSGAVFVEGSGTANISHTNPNGYQNDDLFYWDAWTTGVGTGTRLGGRLVDRKPLAASEARSYSVNLPFHYVLAAGDSATFSIYSTLDAPTIAASAEDIVLRIVVIKR